MAPYKRGRATAVNATKVPIVRKWLPHELQVGAALHCWALLRSAPTHIRNLLHPVALVRIKSQNRSNLHLLLLRQPVETAANPM
ncbi:hypothetical protein [Pseudomonas tohonis]|uniref:hypothetical protein n=1 Tax=Pseudomonas tohonis TaxID=2725477 RepID=UPI001F3697DA|nr:hypothetical protein [Pseudomonas tohonis]